MWRAIFALWLNRKAFETMNLKIVAVILAATLPACSTVAGSGTGSSVQAFADSNRPVSTSIVDAMAGGLIGEKLGSGLDQRERRSALEAEYRALEYTPAGQTISWGQAGRRGGEVLAGSPYRVGSQDCRQYTHTVHFGERVQTVRGAACRNPDGSWTPLA